MRYTFKTFVVLFALISLHMIIVCSTISSHHERQSLSRGKSRTRRVLISVNAVPTAALDESKGAVKDTERSVEASLRQHPPSVPNPTQN